jgi:hypothetical protein
MGHFRATVTCSFTNLGASSPDTGPVCAFATIVGLVPRSGRERHQPRKCERLWTPAGLLGERDRIIVSARIAELVSKARPQEAARRRSSKPPDAASHLSQLLHRRRHEEAHHVPCAELVLSHAYVHPTVLRDANREVEGYYRRPVPRRHH